MQQENKSTFVNIANLYLLHDRRHEPWSLNCILHNTEGKLIKGLFQFTLVIKKSNFLHCFAI